MSEYTQCDKCGSVSHNQAIHCHADGCDGRMVLQRSCSGYSNLMRELFAAVKARDAYKANWEQEKRETDGLRADLTARDCELNATRAEVERLREGERTCAECVRSLDRCEMLSAPSELNRLRAIEEAVSELARHWREIPSEVLHVYDALVQIEAALRGVKPGEGK